MVVAAARVRLNAITATPSPTNGIKSLPHLLPATAPTPAGGCPAPGRARFHLADSSERRNAWGGARCFMVGAGGPGSFPRMAQRQVFERLIARGVSNSVSGGRDRSADGDTVAVRRSIAASGCLVRRHTSQNLVHARGPVLGDRFLMGVNEIR